MGSAQNKKSFFKRFWLLILCVVILVIIFGIVLKLNQGNNREESGGKDKYQYNDQYNTSGYRDIFRTSTAYTDYGEPNFTYSPTSIDEITSIVPLGNANSGERVNATTGGGNHNIPTDHIYVRVGQESTLVRFNVYAVANCTLVAMDYTKGRWASADGTPNQLDDFGFTFQFSRNLFLMILHLTELSPEIQSKVGVLNESNQNFFEIPIKAGELLGIGGGSPTLTVFDLWCVDTNKTAKFIHPERYGIKGGCSVNALDYFAEPLRSQLYSKLPQRPEPRAGEFAYDIDGKLVGNWFPLSESAKITDAVPTLSFFYYNYDPSIIYIGYTTTQTVYVVKNNGPDPATIDKNSGLIKYEAMNQRHKEAADRDGTGFQTEGTFLVQMLNDRNIKVEFFEGKTAGEVTSFTENAIEYDR
jgi:hypothetical protein